MLNTVKKKDGKRIIVHNVKWKYPATSDQIQQGVKGALQKKRVGHYSLLFRESTIGLLNPVLQQGYQVFIMRWNSLRQYGVI